jgi:hypothetical protein
MAKHPARILELARIGAEIQFRDLVQEMRYLLDLFPSLGDSFSEDELPLKFLLAEHAGAAWKPRTTSRRGRRSASAATPKATGIGAKKDWSARRRSAKG